MVTGHLLNPLTLRPDATDLKELDLSFNCFGEKGGEAIGASLHVNTSLTVRALSNPTPRSCLHRRGSALTAPSAAYRFRACNMDKNIYVRTSHPITRNIFSRIWCNTMTFCNSFRQGSQFFRNRTLENALTHTHFPKR